MNIKKHISLKPYNTFGIDVNATRFVEVTTESELLNVLSTHKDIFVISGGSNMLLTKDVDKTVVHLNTKGITTKYLEDNTCLVTANSGENWHQFVQWTVENDLGGLENLSLIPGNVGASPIQNIGAYGVEIKDSFDSLEAIEIDSMQKRVFTKEECQFGYRDSVFKKELKEKYIILNVTFRLTTANHIFHTSYGAISKELELSKEITLRAISDAVIKIRTEKLPDYKKIGNSGSFFKNPIIDISILHRIKETYPEVPCYQISENSYKVPAGWLIEQCGFKGKQFGNTGTFEKQALVLVNHGEATGTEIYRFAQKIQAEVAEKFKVQLEIEVNII